MEQAENTNTPEKKKSLKMWLKRIGVAGFLFFLIKGLLWIAVAYWGIDKIFSS